MNRIDRLFAILQSWHRVRAQDLAASFEVSTRTIYRDIKTLTEIIGFITRAESFDLDDPQLVVLQQAIQERRVVQLRCLSYSKRALLAYLVCAEIPVGLPKREELRRLVDRVGQRHRRAHRERIAVKPPLGGGDLGLPHHLLKAIEVPCQP